MRMIFLVYCIASLFYYVFLVSVLSPGPIRDIFPTFTARYNLFVLKVPLNPKQTMRHGCAEVDTVTVTVGKYAPCILHTFPYATTGKLCRDCIYFSTSIRRPFDCLSKVVKVIVT